MHNSAKYVVIINEVDVLNVSLLCGILAGD